ncbi:MAG: hypothetical protein AMXMBFR13_32920, partial [Phycisphaerae bacterium]
DGHRTRAAAVRVQRRRAARQVAEGWSGRRNDD